MDADYYRASQRYRAHSRGNGLQPAYYARRLRRDHQRGAFAVRGGYGAVGETLHHDGRGLHAHIAAGAAYYGNKQREGGNCLQLALECV